MTILQWNTELEEEEQQLEKNCRDMQWKVQEMVTKNTHLQELYNKVQCANTEMQEKQQQERSQKNEQSLLEELLMMTSHPWKWTTKEQGHAWRKQRAARQEWWETLEELEKRFKKLEVQHEDLFSEMTNLTAQNKDLQELCLYKKKMQIGFLWKNYSAAS